MTSIISLFCDRTSPETASSWAVTPFNPQSRSRTSSNRLWPGGSSSLSSTITCLANLSPHFPSPQLCIPSRVPDDRLRLQLRRLYAPPEAGFREVVSSEAQDNGVYHTRIWNKRNTISFWLQEQRHILFKVLRVAWFVACSKCGVYSKACKVAELHDHCHPRQPWPLSDSSPGSQQIELRDQTLSFCRKHFLHGHGIVDACKL